MPSKKNVKKEEVKPADWFDALIAAMNTRARKVENSAAQASTLAVIGVLAKNKTNIVVLGKDNVMEYLGMIGRGEQVAAKEFFIRHTSDANALIDGVAGSAGTIVNAPNIDWTKTAVAVATAIGEVGARILVTFLIGII